MCVCVCGPRVSELLTVSQHPQRPFKFKAEAETTVLAAFPRPFSSVCPLFSWGMCAISCYWDSLTVGRLESGIGANVDRHA